MRTYMKIMTVSISCLISIPLLSAPINMSKELVSNRFLKHKSNALNLIQKQLTPVVYGGILIAGFSVSAILLAHSIQKTINRKMKEKNQTTIKKYLARVW